ncbi:ABC transporter permease [Rhodopila sp.]|uniref:ABC transporter permease n=1 Tax=Rhodopila sp. TaxID=2480087 RepID=UPI002BF7FB62|nr:ABC transporter permease [Rhodopila sp.]HVZ09885.1 ABC transporter permease [Rhodopila sp.]
MNVLLIQSLTGLATASSLFLLAAGLTVIFGVTRVVNFAHGSLFMLGAYGGWTILSALPRTPVWFAAGIVLTGLAVAAIGGLIEVMLLRRIYHAPELLQLLATFGVVLVLQDLTLMIWGPNDLSLSRPPWLRGFATIGGSRMPLYDLWLTAIGPAVLLVLWLLFTRTRWGTLVRAATQDREMVAALGVSQHWLFTSVFALGAFLAGAGGALTLPDASANLQIDLTSIVDAFVVVVVGGLGSLGGAFLASLLIGLLQAFGILLLPQATLALTFVIMAIVLILRPNGLLGRPQADVRQEAETVSLIGPAEPIVRRLGLAVLLAAIVAPLAVGPFLLSVLTEMLIAALFAASLHAIMGPGGMPSFGQAAWFGIGAYAAAFAVKSLALPIGAGLLAGTCAAGLIAVIVGAFLVRLSGVYLAMLTLAFAQIVWAIAFQAVDLTGGDNGILGVWPPAWAASPAAFYWLTLALCVMAILLLRHILQTPFGYGLRAARDSAQRAAAIGLNGPALRLMALALSGAAAGLAGALTAFSKGSVFPTYISIGRSVDALIMVLLGGIQTMSGPIVGALVYTGLFDALLLVTDLWRLVLGLVIIVLVLAFPLGIAGTVQRLSRQGQRA